MRCPFSEFHPAVLRLIKYTLESGKAKNIDVSVCGELAGSVEGAILLVGMGFKNLSVSPRKINKIKEVLSRFTLKEIEDLASEIYESLDASSFLSKINLLLNK